MIKVNASNPLIRSIFGIKKNVDEVWSSRRIQISKYYSKVKHMMLIQKKEKKSLYQINGQKLYELFSIRIDLLN